MEKRHAENATSSAVEVRSGSSARKTVGDVGPIDPNRADMTDVATERIGLELTVSSFEASNPQRRGHLPTGTPWVYQA